MATTKPTTRKRSKANAAAIDRRRAASRQSGPRYLTQPVWGQRYFESAETTRLNQAHWQHADDESINTWLAEHLPTIRARGNYEARQNGTLLGLINTHADDIVGPDGPTLQVLSDDDQYNSAAEQVWRDWFAAPLIERNVSGAAWLKLCVKSLWKCGEFLAQILTDPNGDEPVKMRLAPIHPRRLATPPELGADPNVLMGIRFDALGRPAQYHIETSVINGRMSFATTTYERIPPDLMIHEFIREEEGQARGVPWDNTALNPAADLRDYDDQVQDAARQMADQSVLLQSSSPDAPFWEAPESTMVERRTIKMCPPGWEPAVIPATQPPANYRDYRSERQADFGRPIGAPLNIVRQDSSGWNYSSVRMDVQGFQRAVKGIQHWLSGSERNTGLLNRLADEVLAEARFRMPALRNRPARVRYQWTWPVRPHVDPAKESLAEKIALETGTLSFTDALAARGSEFETHVQKLAREFAKFQELGLPIPAWLKVMAAGDKSLPAILLQYALQDEAAAQPGATAE